jgi:ribosomal protein S2
MVTNKFLFDKFFYYDLHIGGLKYFWNPEIKPYLLGFRNSFCIFNPYMIHRSLKHSTRFILKLIGSRKKILFLGCPKGLEKEFSFLCSMHGHYVVENYTDGFFSNIKSNIKVRFSQDPPSLIFFFDLSAGQSSRKELFDLNIPVMAFVNCENDLYSIDYAIPANVNSLKGGIFAYNLFFHLFRYKD